MIINITLNAFISIKVCFALIAYKYNNIKIKIFTNYNGIHINNYKE